MCPSLALERRPREGNRRRDRTAGMVTIDSAEITKAIGVAVKCARIAPDEARLDEVRAEHGLAVLPIDQQHHPQAILCQVLHIHAEVHQTEFATAFKAAGIWSEHPIIDDNDALTRFALTLEQGVVETVEAGVTTKDLALLVGPDQTWLTTMGFLDTVDANPDAALAG